jgi:hypothetical protein
MRKAFGRSIGALKAASILDMDRTEEDREFFADEEKKLQPLAAKLRTVHIALLDYGIHEKQSLQAQVTVGDEVLDRGVRDGNTRTKLGVKNKPGLKADHVFGRRVDELTEAKLDLEPGKVKLAAKRLDELPAFDEKEKIKEDLIARADQQGKVLGERDAGNAALVALQSEGRRVVLDCATALVSLKSELDKRFTFQKKYVASFFLNVARKKKSKSGEDTTEDTQEEVDEEADDGEGEPEEEE